MLNKKSKLFCLMLLMSSALTVTPGTVRAAGAALTVNFNATLLPPLCSVKSISDSDSTLVNFGSVSVSELGTDKAVQNLQFKVSCNDVSAQKSVYLKIEPGTGQSVIGGDDGNSYLSTSMSNTGILFSQENGDVFALNSWIPLSKPLEGDATGPQSATLTFKTGLYKTIDNAYLEPGELSSAATMTAQYQ
ncbi:fimbrial protein [Salmonella enterica]|nr:fimbrial protein [Salmonella enterica]